MRHLSMHCCCAVEFVAAATTEPNWKTLQCLAMLNQQHRRSIRIPDGAGIRRSANHLYGLPMPLN